jgi:DNA-binding PadR family transcriptional regulator
MPDEVVENRHLHRESRRQQVRQSRPQQAREYAQLDREANDADTIEADESHSTCEGAFELKKGHASRHAIDRYYIDAYNIGVAADASLKPHWFYILLALADGERHGLAIARDVQSLSDGAIRLWPATLYGSLDGLRARGWIEELPEHPKQESERRRYYRMTAAGLAVLTDEAERLGRLARLAKARVRTGDAR